MRILIATGIFPPDIGGPATNSALLARELPKRNIGVSVVTYGSFFAKASKDKQLTFYPKNHKINNLA